MSVAQWNGDEQEGEWVPLDYLPPAPPANTVAYWNQLWTDGKRLDMGGWNISHAYPFNSTEYYPDDTDYEYLYNNFPELMG